MVLATQKHIDAEEAIWNLFSEPSAKFEITALSSKAEIENTNTKSAKYYDAKLKGNIITVSVKNGADRKKAAKAANAVLEFDRTEINMKSLSGKSGSVKVTMVFDGGIEKSVKIRVKKAKK